MTSMRISAGDLHLPNSAALAYLEKRGIADPSAVDAFKLGFADRTLGLRLPDKRKREGAALRSRLEQGNSHSSAKSGIRASSA
jgi:DNA primase